MIELTLDKCLHEMGLSSNKLAVESNARPNTVIDIVNKKAQRIDFETLDKLLNGLNQIAINRGLTRRFDITDIINYKMHIQLTFNLDSEDTLPPESIVPKIVMKPDYIEDRKKRGID